MKRQLFSRDEIVKALQKGCAIELHFWDFNLRTVEDAESPDGYNYEFEQLPMEVFICHKLRDFPAPWETFMVLGGYWGQGVEADAYAVPKLQSQR